MSGNYDERGNLIQRWKWVKGNGIEHEDIEKIASLVVKKLRD